MINALNWHATCSKIFSTFKSLSLSMHSQSITRPNQVNHSGQALNVLLSLLNTTQRTKPILNSSNQEQIFLHLFLAFHTALTLITSRKLATLLLLKNSFPKKEMSKLMKRIKQRRNLKTMSLLFRTFLKSCWPST